MNDQYWPCLQVEKTYPKKILVIGKVSKYQETVLEQYVNMGYEVEHQEEIPPTFTGNTFNFTVQDELIPMEKDYSWYRKFERKGR